MFEAKPETRRGRGGPTWLKLIGSMVAGLVLTCTGGCGDSAEVRGTPPPIETSLADQMPRELVEATMAAEKADDILDGAVDAWTGDGASAAEIVAAQLACEEAVNDLLERAPKYIDEVPLEVALAAKSHDGYDYRAPDGPSGDGMPSDIDCVIN